MKYLLKLKCWVGRSCLDIDDDNDNYDDPFRSGRGLVDICLLMWHMLGL